MPSFGLPSSMPPGPSSLAPGISTVMSSRASAGPEPPSGAAVPDECMSHLFGSTHLPPPPPLSLSEAAPYSPPPAYPPVFPFGPPLLSSARFPPPPNPSFARPASNLTFFEGPQSHYPPDNTAYDRWSDRSLSSIPYGGDHVPKSFTHWSLPTYNSSININSNNNNSSNAGFLKPEPMFQPFAPYPPVDSVTNFGPKFSPFSGFPNAAPAGMPSTPSASITSPLASGHFSAFPPPCLPLDFPHSSGGGNRFPFNPHSPTFLPGMDPPPAFGPGTAEFMPEPFPSYLSRPGPVYQPSSPFQAPDHFHDASHRPIPSAETTPRPIVSDSTPVTDTAFMPRFYYPRPETIHGYSNLFSHTFSSRSDSNAPGPPLGSSEGPTGLEFSSDFLSSFTLPYPPPHPGNLFIPSSSSAPPLYQDSSSRNSGGGSSSSPNRRDEGDRIVGETGKLLYQHLSPEEWRWKHYEPSFASALDPSGIFTRGRQSGYNRFNGVDSTVYSTVPNSSNGFVFKEEGSSSGALKSQKEQLDMLERSKAQNQSGPSLKVAASALAEMLASGSNGASSSTGRSMLSQIGATSGTALPSEQHFHFVNASNGGQARPERMLEDCCSSSESAVAFREGREGSSSLAHGGYGDLTADPFLSGLNLGSPTRSKREMAHLVEDTFCDFGGAPVSWALPNASGHTENSANPLPISWVDGVPQSAKGGVMHSSGLRRVFSKGSAGIMRQPSVPTGSAKLHGVVAENSASETFNHLFTLSSNQSSRPQSGRMRNVSSEPAGVPPSDDPTSVIGPVASKVTAASGLSLFGPHYPHQEVSSGTSSQLPSDPSHNDQWQVKSTSCGSSPPLSQAHLDQQRSTSGPSMGAASRVLANLKWSCPESSSQTEVAYLGTGFHSLTASISNLSKVLFSLDSSALTPPDSAVLEETLQSSILRLSECLLLEQARINRKPATRFVGSDESSTSRQGRADGSLTDLDFGRHAETGGSTNLAHLKASDLGVLQSAGRSGCPSQPCNLTDLRATSTISALETVDPGGSVIDSHSVQRPLPVNNESYSVSQCSMNDVGFRAGKDSLHTYYPNPKRSSSVQQEAAVGDDIIQLLRENDIVERSSLERLIGAEEREAKLKGLVEELREELELEREENRGTAILCEKIMQEAEVSKGKAVMQGVQIADLKSEKGNVECNLQGGSGTLDESTLDKSSKSEASTSNGESESTRFELGEETDSTSLLKNYEEYLKKLHQVELRLALLRGRPEAFLNGSSGSRVGEDTDATAPENGSEDAVLSNICEGESQQTLLPRPAANAPRTNSPDASGSVESRFALLQARETSIDEHRSHEANYDDEEVVTYPYPWQKQSTKHDTTLDGVEGRLALLHGRPDWDNELGVFTETEPCTPAIPPAVDLDGSTGSLSGHSLSGLNDGERVAFAVKALKAMSHITSQLIIQSETISNMHTAWSQLSEQVSSESPEKESNTELQHKEADVGLSNAATQGYGGSQSVEARALLIRSRPDWTERGMLEYETEDFLVRPFCNIPSKHSGCARYESDQFETMNEISSVRLLDSDVELSQPLQVTITTDCQKQQKENGDTGRVEPLKFENEDTASTQDSEDDSSWEHVPYLLPENEAP
ncbi:unnamed protein product [Calypogeia fissa]